MNWKKLLAGTALVGGVVAGGLAWAPVYLLPYAPIFTWAAEAGIALAGVWGLKKTWDIAKEVPAQKVEPMQIIPAQQEGALQKENQHERGALQKEHKGRFGIRTPKLIAKWRAKKQQNQNYRDAA